MSKYVLNKALIRTANNYKINDIIVDLDINNNYDLNDFNISGDLNKIQISKSVNNDLNGKIGLCFEKYYSLNVNVEDNTIIDNPIIINKNVIHQIMNV